MPINRDLSVSFTAIRSSNVRNFWRRSVLSTKMLVRRDSIESDWHNKYWENGQRLLTVFLLPSPLTWFKAPTKQSFMTFLCQNIKKQQTLEFLLNFKFRTRVCISVALCNSATNFLDFPCVKQHSVIKHSVTMNPWNSFDWRKFVYCIRCRNFHFLAFCM